MYNDVALSSTREFEHAETCESHHLVHVHLHRIARGQASGRRERHLGDDESAQLLRLPKQWTPNQHTHANDRAPARDCHTTPSARLDTASRNAAKQQIAARWRAERPKQQQNQRRRTASKSATTMHCQTNLESVYRTSTNRRNPCRMGLVWGGLYADCGTPIAKNGSRYARNQIGLKL